MLAHYTGSGMVVTFRLYIKVNRTIPYMLTIHCDEELVRTSSLRGEGDGVGTIPVVLPLINNWSVMGLQLHLTPFTSTPPCGYSSPIEVLSCTLTLELVPTLITDVDVHVLVDGEGKITIITV